MKITFVGDTHGRFRQLDIVIKRHCLHNDVVQVGDLGVGFGEPQQSFPDNFFFIHGNHDNPDICASNYSANYIGRYGYHPRSKIMFVSGAWTNNKSNRTAGYDWWPNEELNVLEAEAALNLYKRIKPRYMVTHDAPSRATKSLVDPYFNDGGVISTLTGSLFNAMFEIHQPDIWVFGHHHMHFDRVIKGTRFICLTELEDITLDLNVEEKIII